VGDEAGGNGLALETAVFRDGAVTAFVVKIDRNPGVPERSVMPAGL